MECSKVGSAQQVEEARLLALKSQLADASAAVAAGAIVLLCHTLLAATQRHC